jgi:DNA invertase Pin-like site-specific DNA recombinase
VTGNQQRVFGQRGETRVALYARVSTHDQQTLPLQISAMREYAARRDWTIAIEIEDIGSGASKRPAREEIVRLARQRRIDAVLVWRLDRWGRSSTDLFASLDELHELGVNFVSLCDALDFTTPSGKAMARMLSVFADFERDILRDRVKAGIAEARKQGKPHGRPPTARVFADEVQRLFHQKKMSKRRIAKTLGISRTSVRRLLEDAV